MLRYLICRRCRAIARLQHYAFSDTYIAAAAFIAAARHVFSLRYAMLWRYATYAAAYATPAAAFRLRQRENIETEAGEYNGIISLLPLAIRRAA